MAIDWVDGFLQITDTTDSGEEYSVEGESQDPDFQKAIELTSFEMGSTSGFDENDEAEEIDPEYFIGGLFGEPNEFTPPDEPADFEDHDACEFAVEKLLDYASPDLFEAWCLSEAGLGEFQKAIVSLRKATGANTREVYIKFVFTDVKVNEYRLSIGSDGVPKETVKFSFRKLSMSYRPQAGGGSLGTPIKGGWDVPERTSWTGD